MIHIAVFAIATILILAGVYMLICKSIDSGMNALIKQDKRDYTIARLSVKYGAILIATGAFILYILIKCSEFSINRIISSLV